jgi:hypothetical protein
MIDFSSDEIENERRESHQNRGYRGLRPSAVLDARIVLASTASSLGFAASPLRQWLVVGQ